uniref:Uncharacterized protein n=1 Tax=Fundulus heteroclitus TaxID=8078 RepID=A0A146SH50_FUNHE
MSFPWSSGRPLHLLISNPVLKPISSPWPLAPSEMLAFKIVQFVLLLILWTISIRFTLF